jgi:hypothetical protein
MTRERSLITRRKWSREEDEQLQKLWADPKVTLKEICETLGRAYGSVMLRKRALRLPRRQAFYGRIDWTPALNKRFRGLWYTGRSVRQIALQFDTTTPAVTFRRRKLGLHSRASRVAWNMMTRAAP